jgi:hypothetical protein
MLAIEVKINLRIWFYNFYNNNLIFLYFRSAKVNLKCGANHQLTGVSEPSRCEYEFSFETPAACKKIIQHSHEHDEL